LNIEFQRFLAATLGLGRRFRSLEGLGLCLNEADSQKRTNASERLDFAQRRDRQDIENIGSPVHARQYESFGCIDVGMLARRHRMQVIGQGTDTDLKRNGILHRTDAIDDDLTHREIEG